jgi:hypothetical protein
MKSMDKYVRKQVILDNLNCNLKDLYTQRAAVLDTLDKIDQQILKHEKYLDRLLEEED